MFVLHYPVAIAQPSEDDINYGVEVPDLPGCYSSGWDIEDALASIKEAIEGHIEILNENGATIPFPETVEYYVHRAEYKEHVWSVVKVEVMV